MGNGNDEFREKLKEMMNMKDNIVIEIKWKDENVVGKVIVDRRKIVNRNVN